MNSTIERLLSLRVSDVMTDKVVTVSANSTMAEAARILCDNNISGLPVVDESARCVGVLSAADFAVRGQTFGKTGTSADPESEYVLVRENTSTPFYIEYVAEDRVKQHMSKELRTVTEGSSLLDAARLMCSQHIHRLLVLGDGDRPVGVVSSLDFLAATISAVEE